VARVDPRMRAGRELEPPRFPGVGGLDPAASGSPFPALGGGGAAFMGARRHHFYG
jgi:hypothetical protein